MRDAETSTMKKTDGAIVSATFRDGTQPSLCKISFSFGELQNILVEQLHMLEFLWKSERYLSSSLMSTNPLQSLRSRETSK